MQRFAPEFHLGYKNLFFVKANYTHTILFFLLGWMLIHLSSCKDKAYDELYYEANIPVYMELEAFREAIKTTGPRLLANPGKIISKGNFLFINEKFEGIHIIYNSTPTAPALVDFISIPGNTDMLIHNNTIIADSYIDMVAIDISNPAIPKVTNRLKDIFPNRLPPFNQSLPVYGLDFDKGVVVGWETMLITEVITHSTESRGQFSSENQNGIPNIGDQVVTLMDNSTQTGFRPHFGMHANQIYVICNNALGVYSVDNHYNLKGKNEVVTNEMLYTLYINDNKLFLGSRSGMSIYNINETNSPVFMNRTNQINSCSPLTFKETLIYAGAGTSDICHTTGNRLDIFDITNIQNISLLASFSMEGISALETDDENLFICVGKEGLKVFNRTSPIELEKYLIAELKDIAALRAMRFDDILLVVGMDGIYQYDFSTPSDIQLLSRIALSGTTY
ncbi:MAG: hypothetical protein M0Q41_01810 [Bacteroidales bacterium]|nr:hypothetical protein [Bacteroidales bacterium]